MANNREKQLKKINAAAPADPLERIAEAVWERVTDESRPAPSSMNVLAMEIVKDNPELQHMEPEEKDFFRRCLNSALPGQEISAEEFYRMNKES